VKDIVGMEYSNVLIENASRFVFEARNIVKRSFANVEDFSTFHNLSEPESSYYAPQINTKSQTI
jgi:hypothetical protein